MTNFTEIQKEKMISKEITKLSSLFENVGEGKKEIAFHLINDCAFLSVQLQDLRQTINKEGTTERYQNGANQYGTKKSTAYDNYLAGVKQLSSIVKQLREMLPAEDFVDNELIDFMRSRR